MVSRIKKHLPWVAFALVLSLTLKTLETQGVDHAARERAEVTEIKTAWVEKQTQSLDRSKLGHISQLQKALEVTRGPGSLKQLD